ncbi:MAG: D-tyrosyl-tRNA(Tyr) deacylase [Chthonomonadales bacterium]|nr:D-tyrosyl-tRNA(Tyr) deacylase [Chthonomonadales bacterium]
MRAVVQRVQEASVTVVEGEIRREVSTVAHGFLILIGVGMEDTEADARALADKIAGLRVFQDEENKMNRSLLDVGGGALVISNFTLFGDCRKGRRPSFTAAAPGPQAEVLYRQFGEALAAQGISPLQYGEFGAHMEVRLINDGPVTLLLDSRKLF